MEPKKKLIVCPAYLVTDSQNANIAIMSSTGEDWFPVYHSRDLAEEYAKQIGGESAIRSVSDIAEFQQLLESNPHIAGFLVCNVASPDLFTPVNRQDLVGDPR